ncbi:unnamed protein product, partial [Mesorhabditis belari]|uniref:Zinc finger protein 706 n=1 Tax=Mesorhabditis belari TaxID=2138241 RepID=A0AAF3EE90_9BILA
MHSDPHLLTKSDNGSRSSKRALPTEKREESIRCKESRGPSQKQSAQAALKFKCTVCMAQMPDPITYKDHFQSKHPKNDLPAELQGV